MRFHAYSSASEQKAGVPYVTFPSEIWKRFVSHSKIYTCIIKHMYFSNNIFHDIFILGKNEKAIVPARAGYGKV